MEAREHTEALERGAAALLQSAGAAFDRPVPTCPGWTVADLVAHIGQVWGWAADTLTTRERAQFADAPDDRSQASLCTWAEGEAARLLAALRAADPDSGCWTFGLPRTARFWFRRQALETTLHAWDVENAAGNAGSIESALAADGVDEHLSVTVPRAVQRSPGAWSGQTVHLHRTDGEGEWFVRLGPDGEVVTERRHAKADLALRAGAEALWLWSTNRATIETLPVERFGDAEVAARWRAEIRL